MKMGKGRELKLNRYYKGQGYYLRWRDRDSRLLMRHHKIVAVVKTQDEVDKEVNSFENYLKIVRMNQETPTKEPITIAQLTMFAFTVVLLVTIYILGRTL